MSLPVMPPDPALNQPHLIVDKERRRSERRRSPHTAARGEAAKTRYEEPRLDSAAPVSVDAETGAALVNLDAVDAIPLAMVISRYREDA